MLDQYQVDMLAVAAQHEGRIVQIFTLALMHNDFDTVQYIASNYLTTAHFTQTQIAVVHELLAVIASIQQQAQTVH